MTAARHLYAAACLLVAATCPASADQPVADRAIIPFAREDVDDLAAAAGVRSFRDWTVICDNGPDCAAIGMSRALESRLRTATGDVEQVPVLRLFRPRGRNGGLRIFVDFGDVRSVVLAGLSLHALDDPAGGRRSPGHPLTRVDTGLYALDREANEAFLRESNAGNRAVVTDAEGRVHAVLSTAGLNAALLHMAARQSPSFALPMPENRSDAAPAGPDRPTFVPERLTAEDARYLHALTCGLGMTPSADAVTAMLTADGRNLLTAVECGDRALGFSVWFIRRGSGPFEPVPFPTPDRGPGTSVEAGLANARLDPDSGELTALQHVRSTHDCGWWRRWRWSGTGFDLRETRIMPFCAGLSVGRWPLLYRIR